MGHARLTAGASLGRGAARNGRTFCANSAWAHLVGVFGGARGGLHAAASTPQPQAPPAGQDVNYSMEIGFDDPEGVNTTITSKTTTKTEKYSTPPSAIR